MKDQELAKMIKTAVREEIMEDERLEKVVDKRFGICMGKVITKVRKELAECLVDELKIEIDKEKCKLTAPVLGQEAVPRDSLGALLHTWDAVRVDKSYRSGIYPVYQGHPSGRADLVYIWDEGEIVLVGTQLVTKVNP